MIASSKLGIIAGGGRLPLQIMESCRATGRPFFVLAFDNAEQAPLEQASHKIVRLGAVGEAIDTLRQAGVNDVVMAGRVQRPSFASLKPDAAGAKLLTRLGKAFFAGDDALLRVIVSFLEEEGFSVIGADQLLDGLTTPEGVLGKIAPDAGAQADIAQGFKTAKELGARDVGQAAIVENGEVLGMETAEGTDALITRCAPLHKHPRSGVLVKAKKPGQDARVDLPTIGPETVEKMYAAGFAGIALEAGGSLILDKEKTIARADALGIFVVGTHG